MQRNKVKFLKNALTIILIPVVLFGMLYIARPDNVTVQNIPQMFTQAIAPAILAWGVSFCLVCGNWDFSVGAAELMAAIIGGNLAVKFGLGFFGVAVFSIVSGLVFGLITSTIFYVLRIPTIIVTIGALLIYESLSGVVFNGYGITLPSSYLLLSKFPYNFIALFVVFVIVYYLFNYRQIGFNVRAVGNNANVAHLNGINVYKVKASAMVLASTFAGCYAAVSLGTSGVQKAQSSMASMGIVFDAMMCVFIGMALQNICNMVIGIYVGSVIMQIIKLALMAFGFPSQYNQVVIAVFVLAFMSISTNHDILTKFFAKKKAAV